MLPDRVSNPGPLTYESGVLPIALRGPAERFCDFLFPSLHKELHQILIMIIMIIIISKCSAIMTIFAEFYFLFKLFMKVV